MKQIKVEDLRPGDVFETARGRARVTDVPARCYEGDKAYVLVPAGEAAAQYAPGARVWVSDGDDLRQVLKAVGFALLVGIVAILLLVAL